VFVIFSLLCMCTIDMNIQTVHILSATHTVQQMCSSKFCAKMQIQIFIQRTDFCTICRCLQGLINYIETKAKCHYLKEFIKETLRHVFICLRPRTPYPSSLHTVYVYIVYHPTLAQCMHVYDIYLFTHGRGEGEGRARRLGAWRKMEQSDT
jgi:hypothetical protein